MPANILIDVTQETPELRALFERLAAMLPESYTVILRGVMDNGDIRVSVGVPGQDSRGAIIAYTLLRFDIEDDELTYFAHTALPAFVADLRARP